MKFALDHGRLAVTKNGQGWMATLRHEGGEIAFPVPPVVAAWIGKGREGSACSVRLERTKMIIINGAAIEW